MKILGISSHYHDSAAALVVDGVPVCAVQEERLSRHKNDAGFPAGAIEWCLGHAHLESEELDAVVFYERPMLKFERILTCALRAFPRSYRSFPQAIKNSLGEKVWARGITASLGFAVNEDEYKVMGLAAYGRPTLVNEVRKLIRRTPDGAFALSPEYFEYHTTAARSYSSAFVDLFGPPRSSFDPIDLETSE